MLKSSLKSVRIRSKRSLKRYFSDALIENAIEIASPGRKKSEKSPKQSHERYTLVENVIDFASPGRKKGEKSRKKGRKKDKTKQ